MNIFRSIRNNYYVSLENAIEEISALFRDKRAHYAWLADTVSEHARQLNNVSVIHYGGNWTRNLEVDFHIEPELETETLLVGTLKIQCELDKAVCKDVRVELDVQEAQYI